MDGPGEDSVPLPTSAVTAKQAAVNKKKNTSAAFSSSILAAAAAAVASSAGAAAATGSDPCDRYRHADRFVYINRTGRCAQLCQANVTFSGEEKDFAAVWSAVWAAVCFVCTLLTVVTFLVDASTFRYPQRPIIFIAVCYNIYRFALLTTFNELDQY